MVKEESRQIILEAVTRVVAREGLVKATIEAIAAEAGMSKGGILHHFPSKQAMLLGMCDLYEERFLARRDARVAELPDTPYRLLKATVQLMLEDLEAERDVVPKFASALDDDEMRLHVGEMKGRFFQEMIAGVPEPEHVALVMYAVDGLWMDVRFEPMAIPDAERRRAITALKEFVDTLDDGSDAAPRG